MCSEFTNIPQDINFPTTQYLESKGVNILEVLPYNCTSSNQATNFEELLHIQYAEEFKRIELKGKLILMSLFKFINSYDKVAQCSNLCLIEENDVPDNHQYNFAFPVEFDERYDLKTYVGLLMADWLNSTVKIYI